MIIIAIVSIVITSLSILVAVYFGIAGHRSNSRLKEEIEKYKKEVEKSNRLKQELARNQEALRVLQEERNALHQVQIDDARAANRNRIAPRLRTNGSHMNGNDQWVGIYFENYGGAATISEVQVLSEEYRQHSRHLPFVLDMGDSKQLYFQIIEKGSISSTPLRFILTYRDIEDNIYTVEVNGRNGSYELGRPIYAPE